jgi:hypothetical protein
MLQGDTPRPAPGFLASSRGEQKQTHRLKNLNLRRLLAQILYDSDNSAYIRLILLCGDVRDLHGIERHNRKVPVTGGLAPYPASTTWFSLSTGPPRLPIVLHIFCPSSCW